MPALGLEDVFVKTMTVLAIGPLQTMVSRTDDNFFWVLIQLTGVDVKQGNQIQTEGNPFFWNNGNNPYMLYFETYELILVLGLSSREDFKGVQASLENVSSIDKT